MRVSLRFAVIIIVAAMGMSTLSLGTTVPAAAQAGQRYLLLASGEQLPVNLDALVASVGGRLVGAFDEIGVALATSTEPMFQVAAETLPGIQAVVADPMTAVDVPAAESLAAEAIEVESVAAEAQAGGPPIERRQWNLGLIRAKDAWDAGFLGQDVLVAVVDSGIDAGHPGLVGQVDTSLSATFLTGNTDAQEANPLIDRAAHGTHVAGIIATKSGFPGVAPRAKLMSVKVLKWNPSTGQAEGYESDVIAGILYAANNGARVINTSVGFTFLINGREAAQQLAALNRAVNYAYARGALVVASVGNGGTDLNKNRNAVKAPAQITHVVAVSATGPLTMAPLANLDGDTFAWYSDFGAGSVFVAAPGGNYMLAPNGTRITPAENMIAAPCSRYAAALPACRVAPAKVLFMAGTSMAAAHVSGLAALILSRFGPAMSAAQLRATIQQSADDLGKRGRDEYYGFGRINAASAVTGK